LWPLGDLGLDDDIRRRDFSCNAVFWQLPDGPLDDFRSTTSRTTR
jgi:hypothetical protein